MMAVPTFVYNNVAKEEVPRISEQFNSFGAVIVKGLIARATIESFCSALVKTIAARLASIGQRVGLEMELDDSYNRLCSIDPKYGREVIIVARDLPDFYRLISLPALTKVVSILLPNTVLQIVHDVCLMRIDPPEYTHRNFDWHADYPYNVMSLSSVTAWVPLTPLTKDMGYLKIVPGSHKAIHPVNFFQKHAGGVKFAGHRVYSLKGVDPELLDGKSVDVEDVEPGDVILLHSWPVTSQWVKSFKKSTLGV